MILATRIALVVIAAAILDEAFRWISPMLVQTVAPAVSRTRLPPPASRSSSGVSTRDRCCSARVARQRRRGAQPGVPGRCRERTEPWESPVGGHTGAIATLPGEYGRRVVGFLDAALHPSG
jgi:hypothetical protein